MSKKAYAFVDASNLFYGGVKSLGWKIDYKKLARYLKSKYEVSKIFYFGGIELHGFEYDYLKNYTVPIKELEKHLKILLKKGKVNKVYRELLKRHLRRTHFYQKLESFGYKLYIKPVKLYKELNGSVKKKANCDVEMAYYLMKEKDKLFRIVILSGDGDFLPVLKYLKRTGKEIIILARGSRTAREIKQFAGGNFRDFVKLKKAIEFTA